jgi:hypothetical protein
LCGVLEAAFSFVNLFMQDQDGSWTFRKSATKVTLLLLGKLALAAGACAIGAAVWRSATGKSWLLALNGLAQLALGLTFSGVFGFKISFRAVVLLFTVVAFTVGIFELEITRSLAGMRHVVDQWFMGVAGATSIGFALAFSAMAIRLIELEPLAHSEFLWFGSYFGFSAVCMVGLGMRLHSIGNSHADQWDALPSFGNPKHAH